MPEILSEHIRFRFYSLFEKPVKNETAFMARMRKGLQKNLLRTEAVRFGIAQPNALPLEERLGDEDDVARQKGKVLLLAQFDIGDRNAAPRLLAVDQASD